VVFPINLRSIASQEIVFRRASYERSPKACEFRTLGVTESAQAKSHREHGSRNAVKSRCVSRGHDIKSLPTHATLMKSAQHASVSNYKH
jgi:hypothetical protein